MQGQVVRLAELFQLFETRGVLDGIVLGGDYDLGLGEELGAEAFQFVLDNVIGLDGALFVEVGKVDEVEEGAGSFDVAEEGDAEAVAFRCAFDEARNVSHDKSLEAKFIHTYNAKDGLFGGEGVCGDFRFSGREARD